MDLNALLIDIENGKINAQDGAKLVEEQMKKHEIEKAYGDKVKQLNDGRWWIRIDGKLYRAVTKEKLYQSIYNDFNYTVCTLLSLWDDFKEYRYLHVSGGTYRDDISYFEKYIKDSFIAKKPIRKITTSDLDTWAKDCIKIKTDMREKYFSGIVSVLSNMFQYAKSIGIEVDNIAYGYKLHRDNFVPKKVTADEDQIFSDDEYNIIKLLAYKDAEERHDAIPLGIVVLALTGIRDGELCALKWANLDLKERKIHIVSEMVEKSDKEGKFLGYEYVGHTKTKAGTRIVPLNDEAVSLFGLILSYNQDNNIPCGKDDFIFLRIKKGELLTATHRCFESRIKRYCKQLGIMPKSQHDMRRTFATMLYYNGWKEKDIQKLMGHESVQQTQAYIKYKSDESIFEKMNCLSKSWHKTAQSFDAKEKAQIIDFSTIQALSYTRALEDSNPRPFGP